MSRFTWDRIFIISRVPGVFSGLLFISREGYRSPGYTERQYIVGKQAETISTDDLLRAYALGYFPMARSRECTEPEWVLPRERGIIPLRKARAPRRLLRLLRQEPFEVFIDTAFEDVIAACAEMHPSRRETWINGRIMTAFTALHEEGIAHSIECRSRGRLAGGLYGLVLGAAFCGESMFSRQDNASKIAMLYLIARLKEGGFHFIDAQFFNRHLVQFGLESMTGTQYGKILQTALSAPAGFFAAGPPGKERLRAARVVELITGAS